jgi:protein-S-isoprenylcysteine O-methyltransferase Ste14
MVNWQKIKSRAYEIWVIFRDGRQAKPASTAFNYAKTLLQMVVMWAIFLGLIPFILCLIESWLRIPRFGPFQGAAIGIFVFGATLAFLSQLVLVTRGEGTPLPIDSTRKFVVAGPYRYIRNPMAAGSLMQGYALGLYLGSPILLLYTYIGTLMWNYLARPWEEKDLEAKFGEAFLRYQREVRCWIPRLRPFKS